MPDLSEFLVVAQNMQSRTVALTGLSSALLFSALGAIAELWQWEGEEPLTREEIDQIQAMIAGATKELQLSMVGWVTDCFTAIIPSNCLECDGTQYLREDYPALYAALDPVFIVDADNFVVPDFRGKVAIGTGEAASGTEYTIGQTGGEETHELTTAELASHNHVDSGHAHSISGHADLLAVVPGEAPVSIISILIPAFTGTASANITNTGSGVAHNTMQPFIAGRKVIIAW